MPLFNDVATALRGGLSQPVNFTNFVNQRISQAEGAVYNTINQAQNLGMQVNNVIGTVQNTVQRAEALAAALGITNYGFDPTTLFRSILGGFGRGLAGGVNPNGVLSRMQARADPLLSIDWTATVVDGGGAPIEDIYIEAIQTPSLRFDNKPVYRQGTTVNYAAGLSIDNANLVLYNDLTGKALKFATSWYDAIFNFKTRNFRMPIEYKKDIIVWLLDVQGNVVCQIDLVGCFPVSFNSLQLENTGSNLIPVTLDVSVDHCYFTGP